MQAVVCLRLEAFRMATAICKKPPSPEATVRRVFLISQALGMRHALPSRLCPTGSMRCSLATRLQKPPSKRQPVTPCSTLQFTPLRTKPWPDRAALVLLSDPINEEDGFLQASEIVQLPLNADLVVLSACDTAVGPVQGEEGIETLSRAFLLAGARTVVSSIRWSIDDDTTLYLMKSFYAELAQKKPVPYALRIAKKKMLSTFGPTKALPYYWGRIHRGGVCPATDQRVTAMLDSTARRKIISRIETLVLKRHFNIANIPISKSGAGRSMSGPRS